MCALCCCSARAARCFSLLDKRWRSQRRVRRVYIGRVAEAERSARATEPTTPLDTLGGPLQNLTCAELTLLALLLPQPELLGGAREGLIGQAAQVLFAGVVRQLEDLGVHGPEHELAYVEVVAQVDAVLRVDARLRARPGLELSSLAA